MNKRDAMRSWLATAAVLAGGLARGQDETGGGTAGSGAAGSTGTTAAQPDFWTSHLPADAMGWGWVAATFGVAYAAGTLAFVTLLTGRSPAVALRYALFWMGLVFLGVHFLVFTQLMALGLPMWAGYAAAVVIILLVVIIVLLMRRKR